MASNRQFPPAVNRDKVLGAVTHGFGHITRLQSLLQQLPHGNPWSDLACHVSQEAADALFEALCLLHPAGGKSPWEPPVDPMQHAAASFPSNSYVDDAKDPEIPICQPFVQENSNPKAKRCDVELFRTVTACPDYIDQYQWRKYGQKKIRGTCFHRSYYRCTYFNDQGCSATKRVQQIDSQDPPKFLVTYFGEHTCNSTDPMAANFQHTNALPAVNPKGNMLCFTSSYSEMKNEHIVPSSGSTDHDLDPCMVLDSTGGLIGNKDEMAASSMVQNYYSSSELTSISSVARADQETSYSTTTCAFPVLDGMDMVCGELMEFIEFDAFDLPL